MHDLFHYAGGPVVFDVNIGGTATTILGQSDPVSFKEIF